MRLNENTKEEIIPRIRRIKGQIQGIERMINERRYCVEIINQITAVRRALERLSLVIMESHIETHVVEAIQSGEKSDEIIKELTDTVFKFIR